MRQKPPFSRLLRFTGSDPSAVDPHWDFEHTKGAANDGGALRAWRMRLFVNKPATAHLTLRCLTDDETDTEVPAQDQVLWYVGDVDRDPASYISIEGNTVEVAPPVMMFAANLSRMGEGVWTLSAEVDGVEDSGPPMLFTLVRRPFFTPPNPSLTVHQEGTSAVPAPTPVRSYTGLFTPKDGGGKSMALFRWPVFRWIWPKNQVIGDYTPEERMIIAAVLVDEKLKSEVRLTLWDRMSPVPGKDLSVKATLGWKKLADIEAGDVADEMGERWAELPIPDLVGFERKKR